MNLSRQLTELIMSTTVISDERILSVALQGVTDFFASSLQATNETEVDRLKQWIATEGGEQNSWLIGQKTYAGAKQAALLNGFQAHLLDYDDVHADVRGHPSAVILPALFASVKITSKSTALDSRRFLTAYVIGIEVAARLGQAVNPTHYNKGWHNTATLGIFGATAAICYLHNYAFLQQAFALAATQAGGLRLMFGTSIKPLHAGLAAQNAIQSIELVQAGFGAERDFLDRELGFTAIYGEQNRTLDLTRWGENWKIVEPGLWFKTYSYCSAAAYIADAATELYESRLFNSTQIEQIQLIFPPQGDAALIYSEPSLKSQGRFCAEYIAAKIFSGETLDFSAFSAQPIETHIRLLMAKCVRLYTEKTEQTRFAEVKVRSISGEFFHQRIEHPKGSPHNPYSNEELYRKLAAAIGDTPLSAQLFDDIQHFVTGTNIITFIQKYFHQL